MELYLLAIFAYFLQYRQKYFTEVNMNINSAAQSSYLAQMQSHSKVQSQSAASEMAPETGTIGSVMQQINNQFMSLLDTNKNGSIDKAEFSDAAKKLAQSASSATGSTTGSNVSKAFNSIDKDGDGSINENELMEALKQALTKKKSDAMSARIDNSNVNQTPSSTPSADIATNTNNLQSTLMKNVLSAYANKNLPANGSAGISLKA